MTFVLIILPDIHDVCPSVSDMEVVTSYPPEWVASVVSVVVSGGVVWLQPEHKHAYGEMKS